MRFGGLKQTQTDCVCVVRLITFEPKLSPLTMPVVKFRRNAGEKSLLKLLCRGRSVFRSRSKSKCWGWVRVVLDAERKGAMLRDVISNPTRFIAGLSRCLLCVLLFYRLIRSPFAPVGPRAVSRTWFSFPVDVPYVAHVTCMSRYFMTSSNIQLCSLWEIHFCSYRFTETFESSCSLALPPPPKLLQPRGNITTVTTNTKLLTLFLRGFTPRNFLNIAVPITVDCWANWMERNASFWLRSIEIKEKWIVCVFVCSEGGKVCEKGRGKMTGRFGKQTYSSEKYLLKLELGNLFRPGGGLSVA